MREIAFQWGPITVHWYGIMVALGFLAGLWTASRRAPRAGVPGERIMDIGPWLILGGVAGGRLLYVLTFWREDFAHKPLWEIFMINHGGLIFYGGLIGAALVGFFYVKIKRLDFFNLADILAPSVALGQAFGRIGCWIRGCCYGQACDLPWAVHYPSYHETGGKGVHPTQAYETILTFALYGLLAWLFARRAVKGQVFACYLIGYGLVRLGVEAFRGDYAPEAYYLGIFTPAQMISLFLIAAGGILFWQVWKRPGVVSPQPND